MEIKTIICASQLRIRLLIINEEMQNEEICKNEEIQKYTNTKHKYPLGYLCFLWNYEIILQKVSECI